MMTECSRLLEVVEGDFAEKVPGGFGTDRLQSDYPKSLQLDKYSVVGDLDLHALCAGFDPARMRSD